MTATRYGHPDGHVFYRKMGRKRPMIARGEGIYLYDTGGQRYLDGSGGPLVVNVGHGRDEIVEAMREQAAEVAYVHATMFTSAIIERYTEALAPLVPLDHPRFYLLSSGSEVVEAAIKLARQIQQARGEMNRHIVISRSQSYHGMTLGALGVSGRPGLRAPYLSMLHDGPRILHPYPYRRPMSGQALADRLEEAILASGPANVAAFIAEPISGAGLGAIVPPDDYWPRVRDVCDRHGVLLIADEVLVGMGRTGRWWGLDHWDVRPDILVTSKGVAGGYFPLGVVAARHEDVELVRVRLGDFNHGGTFSHHAVGAAAALATLEIVRREALVDNADRMGRLLGRRLRERLGENHNVGDIRGRGLFWALELVQDRAGKTPFPAAERVAGRVGERAFASGLIIYTSQGCADGLNGDLVMVGPPLIIDDSQVELLVDMLGLAVEEALGAPQAALPG